MPTKVSLVYSVMVNMIFIASARLGRAFQRSGGPALDLSSCGCYIFYFHSAFSDAVCG